MIMQKIFNNSSQRPAIIVPSTNNLIMKFGIESIKGCLFKVFYKNSENSNIISIGETCIYESPSELEITKIEIMGILNNGNYQIPNNTIVTYIDENPSKNAYTSSESGGTTSINYNYSKKEPINSMLSGPAIDKPSDSIARA